MIPIAIVSKQVSDTESDGLREALLAKRKLDMMNPKDKDIPNKDYGQSCVSNDLEKDDLNSEAVIYYF